MATSSENDYKYPLHDQQVCDICDKPAHEAQDCKSIAGGPPGIHCKSCGHGGHNAKKCPLVPSGQKPKDMSDEVIDHFTPKFRAKVLEQKVKTMSSTKPVPSTPTKAPSTFSSAAGPSVPYRPSPAKTTSPTSSLKNPASPKRDLGSSTDSKAKKGSRVSEEQQQLWDAAEKKMPRPDAPARLGPGVPKIQTNFFEMAVDPDFQLYRYSITLGEIDDYKPTKKKTTADGKEAPERERKIKRETKRYLIEELLSQNPPNHANWATDYDAMIISVGELYEGSAQIPGQDTNTPHTRTPKKPGDPRPVVHSSVRYLDILDIKRLKDHVAGRDHDYNPDSDLKALNIISWKNITNGIFPGGVLKNKFYPESLRDRDGEAASTSGKNPSLYQIRNGFFTSMRPGQGSLLLNVNTTTSAFFSPIKLSTWIKQNWNGTPKPKQFKGAFKDVRVTLDLHDESRKWVICGMSEDITIEKTTFPTSPTGNARISVYDYLRRKYPNHKHFDPKAFCVNVGGNKNEVWYPADVLKIVDWQVVKKVLPDDYAAKMVADAERKPNRNKDLILNTALQSLGLKGLQPEEEFYQNFGITPKTALLEIPLVKSTPPKLLHSSEKGAQNGSWDLRNVKFKTIGTLLSFVGVLSFCDEPSPNFMTMLCQQLQDRGMGGGQEIRWDWESVKEPSFGRDGEDAYEKYRKACQENLNGSLDLLKKKYRPSIVLVVLPSRSIALYAEVKTWSDCVASVATVCITKPKVDTATLDLCGNLSLKFNLKMKGTCHQLTTPLKTQQMTGALKNTMIVGADCTHPGKNAVGCPSIAALVATTDDTSSQYLASARLQPSRQEYISDLRSMMTERIRAWYMKSSATKGEERFPSAILFYRDGVSESQFGMVRHEELEQIRLGCKDYYDKIKNDRGANFSVNFKWKENQIKVTLFVVIKRYHARFYPKPNDPAWEDNLIPGSIADREVVTPNHMNFYLQSHASPKGTARGSHYVVLQNDNPREYTLKKLQDITHNLCYVGPRATKALSICVPACYADLLCNRLRCYMRPCLDAEYPKDEEDRDKHDYLGDKLVWKDGKDPERKNPWGPELDNVMFYL